MNARKVPTLQPTRHVPRVTSVERFALTTSTRTRTSPHCSFQTPATTTTKSFRTETTARDASVWHHGVNYIQDGYDAPTLRHGEEGWSFSDWRPTPVNLRSVTTVCWPNHYRRRRDIRKSHRNKSRHSLTQPCHCLVWQSNEECPWISSDQSEMTMGHKGHAWVSLSDPLSALR